MLGQPMHVILVDHTAEAVAPPTPLVSLLVEPDMVAQVFRWRKSTETK